MRPKNLTDGVESDSDGLVLTVFSDIIVDNFLSDGFDLLRRYKLVATFNDHGENLSNFVFLVTIQVSENEGIELQNDQIVTTDQTRD